jgi:hypothetical protein
MNKIITIIILIILQINLFAQSKIMTSKIFIAEDISTINVPSNISCQLLNCKGHKILIEATITADCSDQILNALFKAGVFSIIAHKHEDKIVLSMPNLNKVQIVKGKELNLDVNWNILVPNEIKFIKST